MMKAVTYGEILWDIINDEPHLGGAPLNFAAHLVKSGVESTIISAVGLDDLGIRAKKEVAELNVDTSMVQDIAAYPTGTVDVFLKDGQPDYEIHDDVAFDQISITQPKLEGVDIFYFGTLIQRNITSRETLYSILDENEFEIVFYDVNLRKDCHNRQNIMRSLEYASIIKLNKDEVTEVSKLIWDEELTLESFLFKLNQQYSPKIVLVTDGGNGCYVYEAKELKHIGGVEVEVKDAIGAGDSFSAAFMAKYIKTGDSYLSAIIANKVGAYVASCQGAIPEYTSELKEDLH